METPGHDSGAAGRTGSLVTEVQYRRAIHCWGLSFAAANDIPVGAINNLAQVVEHPQVKARGATLPMHEQDQQYAGFWIRVVAAVIDMLLLSVILLPLLVSIYGWAYFDEERTGFVAGPADFLISWILPAIAVIAFWTYRQATPGKMLVSIKIVHASTGNKPSAGQCVERYLAYFVSAIPVGLGIFWVAIDKKKQGWHDKLANTVVVRSQKTVAPREYILTRREHASNPIVPFRVLRGYVKGSSGNK